MYICAAKMVFGSARPGGGTVLQTLEKASVSPADEIAARKASECLAAATKVSEGIFSGYPIEKPIFDQTEWNSATHEERLEMSRRFAVYNVLTQKGWLRDQAIIQLATLTEPASTADDFHSQISSSLRADFAAASSTALGTKSFRSRDEAVEAASLALNGIATYAWDVNTRANLQANPTNGSASDLSEAEQAKLEREEQDGIRYVMMNAIVQQADLRSSFATQDIFTLGDDGRVSLRATTITSAQYGDLARIAEDGTITLMN